MCSVAQFMANALPFNGQTTGEISDRFQVYFVPAGYVFSIWGLIYLGLLAFAVFQALPAQRDNPRLEFIDANEIRARVPVFSADYLHGGLWDRRGGDLDVDALLQGYLRLFRRRGGRLLGNHEAIEIGRAGSGWEVRTADASFGAPVVVNAAGGWADRLAQHAGLEPLGIQPLRRSALTIDPPDGMEIADWPEMVDIDEDFYFKPDGVQLLCSLADETPSEPCDAKPEQLDVALAIDGRRLERFITQRGAEWGAVFLGGML